MIKTPSRIKLKMMVENHPHLSLFTHIAKRIEEVFANPKKIRKYYEVERPPHPAPPKIVVCIPLGEILRIEEMRKLTAAHNSQKPAVDIHAPNVVRELLLFLQGETGLPAFAALNVFDVMLEDLKICFDMGVL